MNTHHDIAERLYKVRCALHGIADDARDAGHDHVAGALTRISADL